MCHTVCPYAFVRFGTIVARFWVYPTRFRRSARFRTSVGNDDVTRRRFRRIGRHPSDDDDVRAPFVLRVGPVMSRDSPNCEPWLVDPRTPHPFRFRSSKFFHFPFWHSEISLTSLFALAKRRFVDICLAEIVRMRADNVSESFDTKSKPYRFRDVTASRHTSTRRHVRRRRDADP